MQGPIQRFVERRRRGVRRGLLALAAAACGPPPAAAAEVVFDFEELTPTAIAGAGSGALASATSTRDGLVLTVSRSGGTGFDLAVVGGASFPAGWGGRALDPFAHETTDDSFVADLSAPVASVSLEATDFLEDDDLLVLEAYPEPGAGGTLLDADDAAWSAASTSPAFVAVAVASDTPIRSIRFRGGSAGFPNSMFVDNVTVTPVPAPVAGACGVGAAAALGLVARRRRARGPRCDFRRAAAPWRAREG
jgi:hypothetical protein